MTLESGPKKALSMRLKEKASFGFQFNKQKQLTEDYFLPFFTPSELAFAPTFSFN